MNEQNLQQQGYALANYAIPSWEELPKISLYMDQVIVLMEEYLSIYQKDGDKIITPSMINNYVKLGIIPKPEKKRYNRIHLAYLIMVCSLKQILSISMIQKMLPVTMSEKETAEAYSTFKEALQQIFSDVTKQVMDRFGYLLEKEDVNRADCFISFAQTALTGNIYKIIAEKIVDSMEKL